MRGSTDWQLIRDVLNATIDACEAAERLELRDEDRALSTGQATVMDVMTSAWTYPENMRYAVIRMRHDLRDDAPYRLQLARALSASAAMCAELVGATKLDQTLAPSGTSLRQTVEGVAAWYRDQMVPQLTRAAATKANPEPPPST